MVALVVFVCTLNAAANNSAVEEGVQNDVGSGSGALVRLGLTDWLAD